MSKKQQIKIICFYKKTKNDISQTHQNQRKTTSAKPTILCAFSLSMNGQSSIAPKNETCSAQHNNPDFLDLFLNFWLMSFFAYFDVFGWCRFSLIYLKIHIKHVFKNMLNGIFPQRTHKQWNSEMRLYAKDAHWNLFLGTSIFSSGRLFWAEFWPFYWNQ